MFKFLWNLWEVSTLPQSDAAPLLRTAGLDCLLRYFAV
jgi:hypothetical protein